LNQKSNLNTFSHNLNRINSSDSRFASNTNILGGIRESNKFFEGNSFPNRPQNYSPHRNTVQTTPQQTYNGRAGNNQYPSQRPYLPLNDPYPVQLQHKPNDQTPINPSSIMPPRRSAKEATTQSIVINQELNNPFGHSPRYSVPKVEQNAPPAPNYDADIARREKRYGLRDVVEPPPVVLPQRPSQNGFNSCFLKDPDSPKAMGLSGQFDNPSFRVFGDASTFILDQSRIIGKGQLARELGSIDRNLGEQRRTPMEIIEALNENRRLKQKIKSTSTDQQFALKLNLLLIEKVSLLLRNKTEQALPVAVGSIDERRSPSQPNARY
jgi:hypothetical protein